MVEGGNGSPAAGERTAAGDDGRVVEWARRGGVWLLYGMALTPLVFSSRTIYPYVVPRAVFFRLLAAGAAAVAVYLLARRRRGLPGWRRDPFLYALALFVGVLFVTALLGEAPIRSLFGDLERMGGVIAWAHFLAFYLALRTLLTQREFTVFLWVTLAVTSAVSGIAILQEAGVTVGILPGPQDIPGSAEGRAIGTLGNAGYLAIYTAFGMGVGGLLCLRSERVWWRALAALALALNSGGLLLTWTRAALLGVGAGLLVGLGAWAVTAGTRRRRAWSLATVGLLLLLTAVAGPRLWMSVTGGASDLEALPDGSERVAGLSGLQNRWWTWQAGARAVRDRPLTGLGAENFRLAFDWELRPERFAYRVHLTRAHNGLVEYLVAGGVPGLLAWAALWVALFWSLVAARRERRLGRGEASLLAGAFAAYLVYLLFWFHDQNSLPVFVALAALVPLRRDGALLAAGPSAERGGSRLGRAAVALVVALLVAGDAVHHGRLLATGHHLLEAAAGPDPQTRVDYYREAMQIRPPGAEEAVTELTRFAVQLPDAIRAAGGDPGSSPGVDTVLARTRGFLGAQIERDPRNPRLRRDAGRLHVITYQWNRDPAQIDSAAMQFMEAIALAPGRLNYRHMLSETYLMAERPDEAVHVLEEALRRYEPLGETHYFLAKALLVQGAPLEAAEALEKAYERGFRDSNPAVRETLFRALRAQGAEEVVDHLLEVRRAPRRQSR